MGLNVSKAFHTANTILNQNLGKFDSMNIIGMNANQELTYLAQGITKGFYYKEGSEGQGDITEELRVVPETPLIDGHLKNVVMFELKHLDGTFTRFKPISKKPPERPSFQWIFHIKPNEQDTRAIS